MLASRIANASASESGSFSNSIGNRGPGGTRTGIESAVFAKTNSDYWSHRPIATGSTMLYLRTANCINANSPDFPSESSSTYKQYGRPLAASLSTFVGSKLVVA